MSIERPQRSWPNQTITQAPIWCAVDLRDGNQALIEPMNVAQKQRMWHLMVKMGFKHIEVGFPSASQPDFDFVRWLIEEDQIPEDVTIQVLVQARDALIDRTYEALKGAPRAIVHVYNSTSPVQREKVFNLDKNGIIDIARKGAQRVKDAAQQYPDTDWTFQYSPESFSSTETEFAIDVCNAVIDVWQPTVDNKAIMNLPATVECAGPNVFADQVEMFCEHVHQRDAIMVSVHTHNDRGCGVAAAEMAMLAGADRVEGTLMGNGERTGNMDLVTFGMNLYSQGIDPCIDFSIADEIKTTVEACTNIKTHPRHPWFGELVYTAFSGSHQDAIKKCLAVQKDEDVWDVAYLPINPHDVGQNYQSVIRVNSQSGKGGVAYIMEAEYGIALPRWMQMELSHKVQRHSERENTEVTREMIWDIFETQFLRASTEAQRHEVQSYHIEKDQNEDCVSATVFDGDHSVDVRGHGTGTLSVFVDGLHKAFGIDVNIMQYDQVSIGHDNDSYAITFTHIKIGEQKIIGVYKDKDVVAGSSNSVLNAVSQFQSGKLIAA